MSCANRGSPQYRQAEQQCPAMYLHTRSTPMDNQPINSSVAQNKATHKYEDVNITVPIYQC